MQVTVTDLKQFVYCPRIIFYNYVEPVPRKTTFKMNYAREQHYKLNKREKRRGLNRYNLLDGERSFGFPVHSKELNFRGKIDILIDTEATEGQRYFPVECKDTDSGIHNNIKYQLVAYAIAIEEMTDTPIDKGFIYIIPDEKAHPIEITTDIKDYVRKMITMINKIIQTEHYPEPRSRKRCWDCEFKRYCNDLDLPSQVEKKEQNLEKVREIFGFHENKNLNKDA